MLHPAQHFTWFLRFLRRQVRWSGIPISLRIFQFVMTHTVKGFSIVNEADVFLEFPYFFYDPKDVDSLISGSSAFLNSTFTSGISRFTYCWSLARKIFEHYLANMWNEHSCSSLNILWHCSYLDWNENWSFPVLWPLLNFPNLLTYWVLHFNSIVF